MIAKHIKRGFKRFGLALVEKKHECSYRFNVSKMEWQCLNCLNTLRADTLPLERINNAST